MSPFVTWKTKRVPKGAVLKDLQGVERTFAMRRGESFKDIMPAGACFHFDPDYQRDILPVDFYLNVDGMMVCSQRAAEFVRSHAPAALEYLPVNIIDHKGKPLESVHFILHPVDHPDCLDSARSDVTWSPINPNVVQFADHVEIDATRVPTDRLIFCPKSFPDLMLVRRELAEAIVGQGFTGARWVETE